MDELYFTLGSSHLPIAFSKSGERLIRAAVVVSDPAGEG
jgi:hypothetical protein